MSEFELFLRRELLLGLMRDPYPLLGMPLLPAPLVDPWCPLGSTPLGLFFFMLRKGDILHNTKRKKAKSLLISQ